MKRRFFIQQIGWITGGALLTPLVTSAAFNNSDRLIKGKVRAKGRGIAGVVISDGYSVVTTDSKGRYELNLHAAASSVFMSTPAGYAFNHEQGISRHYIPVNQLKRRSADFELVQLSGDDNQHRFIIWADPQVKNKSDVGKMMTESVPDVQRLLSAAGAETLFHGIAVGDIVWDELGLFAEYEKAVGQMGIPFFQCLGNHDMDYNKGDDSVSDNSFQEAYGPTYYSFNRGKAHYIVLDDVRYLGKEREYDGFITQNQLDWLKKDLSFVPKDHLVILCLHIPVHSGVKNNQDLYALLGDRNVHIMSGHTHYNVNDLKGGVYEHNHGTVCGAWWTGPVCGDGTPCGYGVYTVTGNELRWYYQSTGKEKDYQFKIYQPDKPGQPKEILVNIWNYDPAWKTEYFIDGISQGALTQTEGFDPLAYATLLGPDLPKPRGFAEPKKTNHLFKGIINSPGKEVMVIATDRFGQTYKATHQIA